MVSFLRPGVSLILFMSSSTVPATVTTAAASSSDDVPHLPPPDADSDLPTIRLGETIKFEEMGPIILNADGTTRRIQNWDQMTEHEREVTWRRISKRNEERRLKLLELQKQQEESAGIQAEASEEL